MIIRKYGVQISFITFDDQVVRLSNNKNWILGGMELRVMWEDVLKLMWDTYVEETIFHLADF